MLKLTIQFSVRTKIPRFCECECVYVCLFVTNTKSEFDKLRKCVWYKMGVKLSPRWMCTQSQSQFIWMEWRKPKKQRYGRVNWIEWNGMEWSECDKLYMANNMQLQCSNVQFIYLTLQISLSLSMWHCTEIPTFILNVLNMWLKSLGGINSECKQNWFEIVVSVCLCACVKQNIVIIGRISNASVCICTVHV